MACLRTVFAPAFLAMAAAAVLPRVASADEAATPRVEFNRQIRPILSDKCFRCHGPDQAKRRAGLRLDLREAALLPGKERPALVPGKPGESELYRRISASDTKERMPPVRSGLTLSPQEKQLLRQWILEGGSYQSHWAFVPPQSAPLPPVRLTSWPDNAVDRFVLARLEKEGLVPSPAAPKTTLLRRVTLDLTGLPPTPQEMDAFLADTRGDAYSRVVDRLLRSPRFGERMAVGWLDAARYADTNGYFSDQERQMWRWREWVIDAFNRNLPFDQFTVEQLAGDLLPGATQDHLIATGFNRSHMANNESGIIDEEYRLEYVADRVETTATVWLGLTVGCARCHDHKYDPIAQKEYYQLFAFFNNVPEQGLIRQPNPLPVLSVPTPEQRRELAELRLRHAVAAGKFKAMEPAVLASLATWEKTASGSLPAAPAKGLLAHFNFDRHLMDIDGRGAAFSQEKPRFEEGLLGSALSFEGNRHVEVPAELGPELDSPWSVSLWVRPGKSPLACVLSRVDAVQAGRGFELTWQKTQFKASLIHRRGGSALEIASDSALTADQWHHVVVTYDGSGQAGGLTLFVDGSPQGNARGDKLRGPVGSPGPWLLGRRDATLGFQGRIDELRFYQRPLGASEAAALYHGDLVRSLLLTPAAARSARQKEQLAEYYLTRHAPAHERNAWLGLAQARRQEADLLALIPTTLIMKEMDRPRATYILKRGEYDKRGARVSAGTPAVLPPLSSGDPDNRLGLARWLVNPQNPLTARVAVNRMWQHFFGEGLVKTVNDFGAQGEWPSHPELLDWLAVDLVAGGWNIKELCRLLVSSATYRQTAALTPQLLQRDPDNRLLARAARFRLPAEVIRDQALAAGGLLVEKIGGPSVKPYQPRGLWEAVSYNAEQSYVPDRGAGLYRRSLYTFWKRQAPPPALLSFDAPTRETCTARRQRTNTPLQALVLLNDPTYVEAARALAALAMKHGTGPAEHIGAAFRRVLGRDPDQDESDALGCLFGQQRREYRANPEEAHKLLGVGASPPPAGLDPCELAAWTTVASVILNLDEAITRP